MFFYFLKGIIYTIDFVKDLPLSTNRRSLSGTYEVKFVAIVSVWVIKTII
jgi:hypothetical protein